MACSILAMLVTGVLFLMTPSRFVNPSTFQENVCVYMKSVNLQVSI